MKNPTRAFQFLVVLAGSCLFATLSSAASDGLFAQANQEYAAGNFEDAARDYSSMAKSGEWSAALFYNLGNAFFRARDFGRAILNYERALALEPNHPEAQANLRVARDEARALELTPDWTKRFRQMATINQFTAGALIFFWAAAFLFASFITGRKRRGGLVLCIVCILLCLSSVLLIRSLEGGKHGRSLAIVTSAGVQARLATADTSANVLTLPAGSEVQVEQERGDWIYAILPNDLRGWIPAKDVELVRL